MQGKDICVNRQARHDYFILDEFEAGIVLDGGEVKSIRNGSVNLKDSFCLIYDNKLLLKNMHIAVYERAGAFNEKNSRRDRTLLMHKNEIIKLKSQIEKKGLTIIPLKLYFNKSLIKVSIGLAQGKHTFDKKRTLMEKDLQREKQREIKNYT